MIRLALPRKHLFATQAPMMVMGAVVVMMALLDILAPFTSAYADVVPAYAVYLFFFAVIWLSYTAIVLLFELGMPIGYERHHNPRRALVGVLNLACFFSILGVLALVVDRSVYQGIDFFSQSFVEIRARLNSERMPGAGVSSVFSVFGNLTQFGYFFALVCLVYYREFLGVRHRVILWALVVSCLLGGSYILGGRSIIGLFVLTLFAGSLARVVTGRGEPGYLMRVKALASIAGVLLVFVVAVAYVFMARATTSGLSSEAYLNNFIDHLRGRSELGYQACTQPGLCDVLNYMHLSGIYLTHTFWVLAEVIAHPVYSPAGNPVFGGVAVILGKVGGAPEGVYEFSGLFNSLPGALYYQFGAGGAGLGAVMLGVSFAVAVSGLRRGGGVGNLIVFYVLLMTLLVAPVLSVLNMIVYVFVMAAMVFLLFLYWTGSSVGKRLGV